jgi:putative membrane protein
MKTIISMLITAGLVLVIPKFLPGVQVAELSIAIMVAVVLSLLNFFVKPILVLLTLPLTIVTLGLFLLAINAIVILICSHLVDGFKVDSFWIAMLFSIILSILQSITYSILGLNSK